MAAVVLGIGNILCSDDGAGVYASRRLGEDSRTPPGTVVYDAGTLGLDMLSYVEKVPFLLLLDVIDTGESPGTVTRFDISDLRNLPRGTASHELGVADLLAALTLMESMPAKVVLIGIQPENLSIGLSLSDPVEQGLGEMVEQAVAMLEVWTEIDINTCSPQSTLADI
jgi:hydrogenase maturation protease